MREERIDDGEDERSRREGEGKRGWSGGQASTSETRFRGRAGEVTPASRRLTTGCAGPRQEGFMMGVEEPRKGGERICAKECAGHGGMESVITAYRLVVVPHPQCWPHIFSFTIFLYSFTP